MSTVSPDSVAQDHIRSFVERIMRLREEVKAINGDIREVYAEAKGDGFDKTVLGKLVSYIEKRATGAADLQEAEALFDLYLSAYDGVRPSHAHAREDEMDRNAEPPSGAVGVLSGKRPEGEPVNPEAGAVTHAEAGENPAPIPPPAEGNTPTSAGHGDESATHAAALVVDPIARVDADAGVDRSGPGAPSLNSPAPVANVIALRTHPYGHRTREALGRSSSPWRRHR